MIYRDKSVGNLIRISVVKLILLKEGGIIWLKNGSAVKTFYFAQVLFTFLRLVFEFSPERLVRNIVPITKPTVDLQSCSVR